jgi:hypothetical protein
MILTYAYLTLITLCFINPTFSQKSYKYNTDTTDGIVWYPPVQISPDKLYPSGTLSLAAQGDTLHITFNSSIRFPYLRSTDGGVSFEDIREITPDSLTDLGLRFIITNGSYLYAGFQVALGPIPQSDKNFLMYSSDRGTTWSKPINFPDSTHFITYSVCNDTLVFVNANKKYSRHMEATTDKGKTWLVTNTDTIFSQGLDLAMTPGAVHFVKGWLFDSSGHQAEYVIQYRKSTDLGKTWSDSINLSSIYAYGAWEPQIATSPAGDDSPKVAVIWTDAKYGCLTMTGCSVMERHLNVKDSVWSDEVVLTPEPRGTRDDVAIDKSIIAATWTSETILNYVGYFNLYINISRDGGKTWCTQYNLTPGFRYAGGGKVAIVNSKIHVVYPEYIGEPNVGEWKIFYRRGEIMPSGIQNENEIIPQTFSLTQNYPNPFNPSTELKFEITDLSYVTLKIYDLMGREISTLVNEQKIPGVYRVEWNAENQASGVYYYRLTSYSRQNGLRAKTKKMVLMK